MNALQRNDMAADTVLANDRIVHEGLLASGKVRISPAAKVGPPNGKLPERVSTTPHARRGRGGFPACFFLHLASICLRPANRQGGERPRFTSPGSPNPRFAIRASRSTGVVSAPHSAASR
jgi:hypothetical protein